MTSLTRWQARETLTGVSTGGWTICKDHTTVRVLTAYVVEADGRVHTHAGRRNDREWVARGALGPRSSWEECWSRCAVERTHIRKGMEHPDER
jgi:hypothetical protein